MGPARQTVPSREKPSGKHHPEPRTMPPSPPTPASVQPSPFAPPSPGSPLPSPPLLKPSQGSWKVVDMVAMVTEFRTGEKRRRRRRMGWAREEGGRASWHLNRAWTLWHHVHPPQHPTSITLNRIASEDEEGQTPTGGCQGWGSAPAPQPQPGDSHPCPALPKGTGGSRLTPAALSERALTRHHPAPSICFDPQAKHHVPQRESRSHLGRS